jgi:hypothetical protein
MPATDGLLKRSSELPPSPDALMLAGKDIRGATLIIPLDAPMPSELKDIPLPTGPLVLRLAPLAVERHEPFGLVALSGTELLALDRVFRYMQVSKQVYVLLDIPGAVYDPYFTQATRVLGLRAVNWDEVSGSMAAAVRTQQRVGDKTPWIPVGAKTPLGDPKPREVRPLGTNAAAAERALPKPHGGGEEAGDEDLS